MLRYCKHYCAHILTIIVKSSITKYFKSCPCTHVVQIQLGKHNRTYILHSLSLRIQHLWLHQRERERRAMTTSTSLRRRPPPPKNIVLERYSGDHQTACMHFLSQKMLNSTAEISVNLQQKIGVVIISVYPSQRLAIWLIGSKLVMT